MESTKEKGGNFLPPFLSNRISLFDQSNELLSTLYQKFLLNIIKILLIL